MSKAAKTSLVPRTGQSIQVVAVDWIFSSRIKFVGLEPILEDIVVADGAGPFLTFWRSLGGSPGEDVIIRQKKEEQRRNHRQRASGEKKRKATPVIVQKSLFFFLIIPRRVVLKLGWRIQFISLSLKNFLFFSSFLTLPG